MSNLANNLNLLNNIHDAPIKITTRFVCNFEANAKKSQGNDDPTATFIARNGGSTSHMRDLMTTLTLAAKGKGIQMMLRPLLIVYPNVSCPVGDFAQHLGLFT